jgi:hypothetical protein
MKAGEFAHRPFSVFAEPGPPNSDGRIAPGVPSLADLEWTPVAAGQIPGASPF